MTGKPRTESVAGRVVLRELGITSSDEAAGDAEDVEHVTFILMRADGTLDGQDRVMSRAAYDLQCRATVHSAFCGHPGFVPDEYLSGLSMETTITAVELCTVGIWERVDGGYRVLDWEAAEICHEQAGQARGEDVQALAWERDHEATVRAQIAKAMVVTPPCAMCGTPSGRVELVAPGHLPAQWEQWPGTVQAGFVRQREPRQWYLLFNGVATCNGYGEPIDASHARRITQAFRAPLCFAQVHTAGFYDDAGFCQECDAPYCHQHWHVSASGYGYCPRGHGKSLDPHRSP